MEWNLWVGVGFTTGLVTVLLAVREILIFIRCFTEEENTCFTSHVFQLKYKEIMVTRDKTISVTRQDQFTAPLIIIISADSLGFSWGSVNWYAEGDKLKFVVARKYQIISKPLIYY